MKAVWGTDLAEINQSGKEKIGDKRRNAGIWKQSVLVLILLMLSPPLFAFGNASEENLPFTRNPMAIEQAAASAVKLEVFDYRGDRIATGSGFAAFSPHVLVTAAHVIVNMEYIMAETDSGETFRIDQLISADTEADVALCRLPEGIELPLLPASQDSPLRGESVAVIGTQFGLANLVTLGNISGCWENGSVNWILFTAPVSGGCSGGPLLNDSGEVVGIVTGTYEKAQNLNLAAPIEKVQTGRIP